MEGCGSYLLWERPLAGCLGMKIKRHQRVWEKTNFDYKSQNNVFMLVRWATCYQEVVPLIPHLSAGNRHQGHHTWPPWYSYRSGELHAWSKFFITLYAIKLLNDLKKPLSSKLFYLTCQHNICLIWSALCIFHACKKGICLMFLYYAKCWLVLIVSFVSRRNTKCL